MSIHRGNYSKKKKNKSRKIKNSWATKFAIIGSLEMDWPITKKLLINIYKKKINNIII